MAASHFTTILCEPNRGIKYKESQILIFFPVLPTSCMLGLKMLEFLCTSLRAMLNF